MLAAPAKVAPRFRQPAGKARRPPCSQWRHPDGAGTEEAKMAKTSPCDDGYVARGETDEELVENALAHIRSAHPDLVGRVTREQLLAMAVQA
jgi:hypothetical protein